MLKEIVRLCKSINTNSHPGEIAHAVCIGFLLGVMPKDNALWFLIFVFTLFMRINKGAFALGIILFSMIAPVFDGLLDAAAYPVLTNNKAVPFFRALLDIPFVAFTKINNSIVAGALMLSIAAYIPLYFICIAIIKFYREAVASKIKESAFYKAFLKMPLVSKINEIAHNVKEF